MSSRIAATLALTFACAVGPRAQAPKHLALVGGMLLTGYDAQDGLITDANGVIQLVSGTGELAAAWSFTGFVEPLCIYNHC